MQSKGEAKDERQGGSGRREQGEEWRGERKERGSDTNLAGQINVFLFTPFPSSSYSSLLIFYPSPLCFRSFDIAGRPIQLQKSASAASAYREPSLRRISLITCFKTRSPRCIAAHIRKARSWMCEGSCKPQAMALGPK